MTHAMPAFDTLKYAESLQAAGVPEPQAKAHARAAADAYDVQLQRLATKGDLRLLASDLRSETAELRSEMTVLRGEMTVLRGEMKQLGTELRGEVTQLRTELQGEMVELRSEFRSELKLIKWISVTTAAAVLSQIAKGFM